jgi:hypothetical protein
LGEPGNLDVIFGIGVWLKPLYTAFGTSVSPEELAGMIFSRGEILLSSAEVKIGG